MEGKDTFLADKEICMNYEEGREDFHGAVVPPVFGNTLFTFRTFENLAAADNDLAHHYVYRRGPNPTVEVAERKLAALERGEACRLFGSRMAAISAALLNSLKQGDHLLVIGHIYATTLQLIRYLQKFGISFSVVYNGEFEQAIRPNTRVIYMESPTNMVHRIIDLEAIADFARKKGIRTIIDNTWATPLFQKPLTLGIDMVIHSGSKYLGGHSDCMAGAVIASKEIMDTLFHKELLLLGAVLSPYDAALLVRGLRTLPMRMKAHEKNAALIAAFLEKHPAVRAVNYPGLASHPDYERAKQQMYGFSGLLSFELKQKGFEKIAKFMDRLKVFKIGVSWGSFESLTWAPFYGTNEEQLRQEHLSPELIRLAVGLEDTNVLLEDLDRGLSQFV
ncbi:UNVERIFIED_ORG: cystathionine beta-lyase/cystathionine gamma-synthase [Heyndrickxia coagulans]